MSLDDVINTVKREIDRRRRTYPGLVKGRAMTEETAFIEITAMEEVLQELREVEDRDDHIDDLERTFDLRWDADIRAIKRWREGHPERELIMPDHADLVCWLLEDNKEILISCYGVVEWVVGEGYSLNETLYPDPDELYLKLGDVLNTKLEYKDLKTTK